MPDCAGVPLPRPPSPSCVRDALLGGRRNLHADRDLADRLEVRFPGTAQAAAEARAFTGRAVTWCARQGIAQYIVPEPGLPLPGGAADLARAVIPGARVVYADTDPSAFAYARAEASRDDATAAVRGIGADNPARLLADPALRAVIDLGEPAAAVLAMIAHLMPGREAARMVAGFAARLAPGSAVIMSAWVPHPGAATEQFIAACRPVCVFRHTVGDIEAWLSRPGLEIVKPGVTDVRGWSAGMPEPRLRHRPAGMTAGVVARVPSGP
jgi:SAM-dependent methyltransferase